MPISKEDIYESLRKLASQKVINITTLTQTPNPHLNLQKNRFNENPCGEVWLLDYQDLILHKPKPKFPFTSPAFIL